jgi:uncharacterized protein DUF6487
VCWCDFPYHPKSNLGRRSWSALMSSSSTQGTRSLPLPDTCPQCRGPTEAGFIVAGRGMIYWSAPSPKDSSVPAPADWRAHLVLDDRGLGRPRIPSKLCRRCGLILGRYANPSASDL